MGKPSSLFLHELKRISGAYWMELERLMKVVAVKVDERLDEKVDEKTAVKTNKLECFQLNPCSLSVWLETLRIG